jgi:hypothetical protein
MLPAPNGLLWKPMLTAMAERHVLQSSASGRGRGHERPELAAELISPLAIPVWNDFHHLAVVDEVAERIATVQVLLHVHGVAFMEGRVVLDAPCEIRRLCVFLPELVTGAVPARRKL